MPNLPTANGGENKAPMGNHTNSKSKPIMLAVISN